MDLTLTLTLNLFHCALFGIDGALLDPHASALGLVKDEGGGTGEQMGFAIDAVVESVTRNNDDRPVRY